MENKTISYTLTTTIIGTNTNTYEICKECGAYDGEEVIIIQLYPTIGIEDIGVMDTTTLHLQNKMRQLGWSKIHIVNLFSQITKQKPLSADLPFVDNENMEYLKKTISEVCKHGKLVISWGNSHGSNKVVNESKRVLLEYLISNKIKNVFQLVAESMTTETEGTHILFLGLRYANDDWQLNDYPIQAELERILALLKKRQSKEVTTTEVFEQKQSKKGKVKKNVSANNEST